ncbi:hypothetical protein QTO34_004611 [Cnephaeus nilssonii]|uniref:Laminin G domain-containing protein n=1 Tax=Cnephaeus nilssonii TaxID=3371016 RepID=A0AA40HPM9_CNENI|nr:hypothetical protein QTO34_004611 [Eptesicus nilssonii]
MLDGRRWRRWMLQGRVGTMAAPEQARRLQPGPGPDRCLRPRLLQGWIATPPATMPGQIPDPSMTVGPLPGLGPLTGLPSWALTSEELKYADIHNIGAMIAPLHFLEVKLGKRPQPVKSELDEEEERRKELSGGSPMLNKKMERMEFLQKESEWLELMNEELKTQMEELKHGWQQLILSFNQHRPNGIVRTDSVKTPDSEGGRSEHGLSRGVITLFLFHSRDAGSNQLGPIYGHTSVMMGSLLDDHHWHSVVIERQGRSIDLTLDRSVQHFRTNGEFDYLDLDYEGNLSFSCVEPYTVPVFFNATSYLEVPGRLHQDLFVVSFQFRTWNPNGLLLFSHFADNLGNVEIDLTESKVGVHINVTQTKMSQIDISSGVHSPAFIRIANGHVGPTQWTVISLMLYQTQLYQ